MQTPCQQSHASSPTSAVPRQQSRASSPAPAVPQYLAPHGGVTPAHHHPAGDTHPHFMYNVLYIGEQRSTP